MASKVNQNDPTEKFSPQSTAGRRALKYAAWGALAGGLAVVGGAGYMGKEFVAEQVATLISKVGATLPSLGTFAGGRLSSLQGFGSVILGGVSAAATAGIVGAGTGAGVGLIAKQVGSRTVKLSEVKEKMGIDSDFQTFRGVQRVVQIGFKDGTLQMKVKPVSQRIHNLNERLTVTEKSLSQSAVDISDARANEDRYFDFEGRILAESGDILTSLVGLKAAIHEEIKRTDKYTFQKGNSQSSLSRRDYVFASIMKAAYFHGIAENYLAAAIQEREETAKTDAKLADENFKKAIQAGVNAGILNSEVDPHVRSGMLKSAAFAAESADGRNPDAAINEVFDQFVDTGLISSDDRSRFAKEIEPFLSEPVSAQIAEAKKPEEKKPSLFERIFGRPKMQETAKTAAVAGDLLHTEEALTSEKAEEKALLAREAQEKADGDLEEFSSKLTSLEPYHQELVELYKKLAELLTKKSGPLKQILDMGKSQLRGALVRRHKDAGFDLLAQYEVNDAAISETRAAIQRVAEALDEARSERPENFKLASKARRRGVEALEKQVKVRDGEVTRLKERIAKLDAAINELDGTLGEDESDASVYLLPENEEIFSEPVVPKKPGFLDRLRQRSTKEEVPNTEESGKIVEEMTDPVAPASATEEADDVVAEDILPDPVVVE